MFGIGGGELVFILFIVLMLFGSDKIPELARALGKGMAQLKNATNEIKSEIHKGMDENGITQSMTDITGNINAEIDKAKQNLIGNAPEQLHKIQDDIVGDLPQQVSKTNQDIEEMTGPIKRQGR
ncbi:Sec-independent protein translocase subunit TatA/TatB [Flavobacterium caeni]|uniref:Sec-independent protein translocase protein TatA n=1 Tax=Flavobacterium caeni TaxID=490189 RepID=A0A1G5I5J2_9FLAO|nr:twin-arginine translocase TatA/TatE family subunit [Flavobacterium caeni]SCY71392.1 sec-independent protein translocase protein TatA [Flavobacterium caeni]